MYLDLQRPPGQPCPACYVPRNKPCKPNCSSIYRPPRISFLDRLLSRLPIP
jgi:hypothetical protein